MKGGTSYGETDELGFAAAVNRVHVHECTQRFCI